MPWKRHFARIEPSGTRKKTKKWKFAKNLVQSAEFFIIWRFAFPDVIVASDRVA
jgi:hypothetical protein